MVNIWAPPVQGQILRHGSQKQEWLISQQVNAVCHTMVTTYETYCQICSILSDTTCACVLTDGMLMLAKPYAEAGFDLSCPSRSSPVILLLLVSSPLLCRLREPSLAELCFDRLTLLQHL